LASSAQEPGVLHWESSVQAAPALMGPRQCFPGPAPLVQFAGEVPALGVSCTVAGHIAPPAAIGTRQLASKNVVFPSGMSEGGVKVASPPPM
jgi:hypothetical protein